MRWTALRYHVGHGRGGRAGRHAGGAVSAEAVIDVTGSDEPPARSSGAPAGAGAEAEALFEELDDPDYEELWEGTQAMRLEMPEIPPLDLDWGDGEDDLDDPRD
jgi:hypothetical protein